jgi:hypothetical protein
MGVTAFAFRPAAACSSCRWADVWEMGVIAFAFRPARPHDSSASVVTIRLVSLSADRDCTRGPDDSVSSVGTMRLVIEIRWTLTG